MTFRNISPYGQVTPADFNRLSQQVERLSRITATPPLGVTQTEAGVNIYSSEGAIWARLGTNVGGGGSNCTGLAYSWTQVTPTGSGGWTALARGMRGTSTANPAYELNGKCIEDGTIVRLYPGVDGEFLFDAAVTPAEAGEEMCQRFTETVSCSMGTLSVVEKYLRLRLPGDGTWSVTDTACSSSSSSTSSGASSSASTTCNAACGCLCIPTTIYATFENVAGCDCLDGVVVPLTGSGTIWNGSGSQTCEDPNTVRVYVSCQPPYFQLTVSCPETGSNNSFLFTDAFTCDPLEITFFGASFYQTPLCCTGQFTVTVTQ